MSSSDSELETTSFLSSRKVDQEDIIKNRKRITRSDDFSYVRSAETFDCTSSTQMTQSSVSFAEVTDEEDDVESGSDSWKYTLVFTIVAILLFAYIFGSLSNQTSNENELLQTYRKKVEETTRDLFSGSRKISALFCYAGEFLLTNRSNCCGAQSPLVLLLVGHDNQTAHFLEHFRRLTKSLEHELLDYAVSSLKSPSRQELETIVFDHLKNNRVLILRGIDRLKSTAPLLLQSITDPESSPFKNALIVATLSPTDQSQTEEGVERCDEKIFSYLLRQWTSEEMEPDSVIPIISRISAIAHCF